MQPYRVLCIETICLVQGLLTGSNVVLNSIWSPTDYNFCGNEIIEYCGADVRMCFIMQATEQVAMTLTYVIRRKPIMEFLPLPSQYILFLLLFMIRNKNQFHINSEIHQNNTRQHANLKMDIHIQSYNTDLYKRSVIKMGTQYQYMLYKTNIYFIQTIRPTVFTQYLKPTSIHLQLI